MVKKIIAYSLSLLLILNNTYALEYIIEWENVVKEKESFSELMFNNTCTDNKLKKTKQLELFLGMNKKNYSEIPVGKEIRIQTCYQKSKYTDEELNIQKWDFITTEKDFILSRALEARGCSDGTIFQRHIPHLKIKNNYQKAKDVNRYQPGEELWIQDCRKPVSETPVPVDNDFIYFVLGREEIGRIEDSFLEVGYKYNLHSIFQRVSNKKWSLGGFYVQELMSNIGIFAYPHFVSNNIFGDYSSLNYGISIHDNDLYSLKFYNSANEKEEIGIRFDLYIEDYGIYYEQNSYFDTKNFGFILKF